MNYATTYPVRDNYRSPRQKAKAAQQAVSGVRPMDGKTQRCLRDTEGQKKVGSGQPTAHDFLKSRFLPKMLHQEIIAPATRASKLVRDFYKSLTQLAEHYGIQPMPTAEFEYPYNIALTLSDVKEKLKSNVTNWYDIRVVLEGSKTYLTSEERYCTGTTLFFIPVIPVFLMLRDKKRRKAGVLLLSACAYLYQIADIPYYRQEYTSLYWQYEMYAEMIEQDEDTDGTAIYRSELQQAEWVGDKMEQKLINPNNLAVFQQRIKSFTGRDGFEKQCLQVSKKAYDMFSQYPNEKFFRNANAHNWVDEDFDNDHILSIERYISFSARSDGWLSDSIFDSLNQEFGEYGEIEEPSIKKSFNGKSVVTANLDFEHKLFTLLDDLARLLNNYTFQNHE